MVHLKSLDRLLSMAPSAPLVPNSPFQTSRSSQANAPFVAYVNEQRPAAHQLQGKRSAAMGG